MLSPITPNPPPPPPTPPLPASFLAKKGLIHAQLTTPSPGDDLSPKGSVDAQIRPLIDEVNARAGCVTTSSCAGRISVFLEGRKRKDVAAVVAAAAAGVGAGGDDGDGDGNGDEEGEGEGEGGDEGGGEREREKAAGVGGKGAGGRWLFVSHDPVDVAVAAGCAGEETWARRLGMQRLLSEGQEQEEEQEQEALQRAMGNVTGKTRLVHFKFEPMILHVLTASLAHAQTVLSAALQAGFRESGALNLTSSSSTSSSSAAEPPTPMVGIRSMGLALESVVGFESAGRVYCMVPEWQLRTLLEISNQRFVENAKRMERFRRLLKEMSGEGRRREEKRKGQQDGVEWEDAGARRERKRKEGLERAEEMRKAGDAKKDSGLAGDGLDLGILDGNT